MRARRLAILLVPDDAIASISTIGRIAQAQDLDLNRFTREPLPDDVKVRRVFDMPEYQGIGIQLESEGFELVAPGYKLPFIEQEWPS